MSTLRDLADQLETEFAAETDPDKVALVEDTAANLRQAADVQRELEHRQRIAGVYPLP